MPNFSGIWTITQQMQAKGASTWPATPGAPTIGTATGGNAQASVTFTAPSCTGYPAGVTGYRVISTPGCISNTGASSPIVVTGLTNGTAYTFKAQATNATGYGPLSSSSNSVTPVVITCATYTTPGTYSWVAPTGVTSVAVVAIAGGAGSYGSCAGGGGGLAYINGNSVTPGNSYTVVVGAGGLACQGGISPGGNSTFRCSTVIAYGAGSTGAGGLTGSPNGSRGGSGSNGGAGGGAGGYTGNGGNGGNACGNFIGLAGQAGSGGGGGGGGGSGGYSFPGGIHRCGGGAGGGTSIYGQGCNGAGGTAGGSGTGGSGGGGSGGNSGSGRYGGAYGGGAGRGGYCFIYCCGYTYYAGGRGGGGAVRIVWCKCGARGTPSFPSTNVGP